MAGNAITQHDGLAGLTYRMGYKSAVKELIKVKPPATRSTPKSQRLKVIRIMVLMVFLKSLKSLSEGALVKVMMFPRRLMVSLRYLFSR